MIEIYHEDCFDRFALLDENSIDYVFTSPPYNRKRNDKYEFYDDQIEDYFEFLCQVIDESLRISRKNVFLNIQKNFYNKKEVFQLFGQYCDEIKEVFIWEKSNPLPASGHFITNAYEFILVFGEKLTSNKTYTKNILKTSVSRPMFGHRAVMKTEVAEFFIQNFTQENEIIYDPFSGVGTTALVASKLNRKCIGSELTKEYYDASLIRIKDVQLSLF